MGLSQNYGYVTRIMGYWGLYWGPPIPYRGKGSGMENGNTVWWLRVGGCCSSSGESKG